MDFPILENLTNIDFHYREFAKKCHQLLETPINEVGQVVLFSQGGVDQINSTRRFLFLKTKRLNFELPSIKPAFKDETNHQRRIGLISMI